MDKEKLKTTLEAWITGEPGWSELFIVRLKIGGQGKETRISVFLDKDTGITIQECSRVSRVLAARMEEEKLVDPQHYVLEVSSPGLDEPLVLPRQFQKNIGRTLRLEMLDGSLHKGKLLSVAGDSLQIEPAETKNKKKKEAEPAASLVEINRLLIKKATIEIAF